MIRIQRQMIAIAAAAALLGAAAAAAGLLVLETAARPAGCSYGDASAR